MIHRGAGSAVGSSEEHRVSISALSASTIGGTISAIANTGRALSEGQVEMAAAIRMQQVRLNVGEMALTLIERTMRGMAEMGATVDCLA